MENNGNKITLTVHQAVDSIQQKLISIGSRLEKNFNSVLRKYLLNYHQYLTLLTISNHVDITQKQLSVALSLEKSNISKIVNKLQSKKLVLSKQLKTDKRKSCLAITKTGTTILNNSKNDIAQEIQSNLHLFQKSDLKNSLLVLHKIEKIW